MTAIQILRPRAFHVGWRSIVRWVLVAGSVALLARLVTNGWADIREAAVVLVTQQTPLIALVIALEALWTLSLPQVTRQSVLAVGGLLPGRDALRVSMASFTLSRVVPGGGAAGGVFATRELVVLGNPLPVALTAMMVSWAVSMMTLAALVLTGSFGAAFVDDLPLPYLVPSSAVLVVLAATGFVVIRMLHSQHLRASLTHLLARLVGRSERGARAVAGLTASLDGMVSHLPARSRLAPAAAWSATAWLADVVALWLIFHAFGHTLGLREIVIGYGFANLMNTLPELTPGWIGVFEASVSATYIALGVPTGIAVAAVLSYRLVSFWLPVAAGVAPALTSLAARRGGLTTPMTGKAAA